MAGYFDHNFGRCYFIRGCGVISNRLKHRSRRGGRIQCSVGILDCDSFAGSQKENCSFCTQELGIFNIFIRGCSADMDYGATPRATTKFFWGNS